MTAAAATRFANLAERAIENNGVAITVIRPVASDATYDPATGSASLPGGISYAGVGLRLDFSFREIDGTNIRAGDARVLVVLSNRSVRVKTGDEVSIGGTRYDVVAARLVELSGAIVYQELQVRGT